MLASIDTVAIDPDDGLKAFMELTYDTAAETLGVVQCKHGDLFYEKDAEISELLDSLHKAHYKYIKDKSCGQRKERYQHKKQ